MAVKASGSPSALAPVTIAATGAVTSSGGGIGYAVGAGGTVTQATSKATAVTLSKLCGEITLNGASLAADTTVSFTLTNTFVAAGDLLILQHVATGTFGAYILNHQRCGSGSVVINIHNATPGALAEAIVVAFAVHKATTA